MLEKLNCQEIAFFHDVAEKIARDFFRLCGSLPDAEMDAALLEAITNFEARNPDLAPWLVDEMASAICDHVWALKGSMRSPEEGAA